MRRVYYASGSFLTSTSIASAIVDYAHALARTNGSDVVEFPIAIDGGHFGAASVLIGPASQIASASEFSELEEPVDAFLLEELQRKTQLVGVPRPLVQADGTEFSLDDEFE